MNSSTILLTGAMGALGRHILKKFNDSGAEVIASYNRGTPTESKGVRWVQMDLTDASSVSKGVAEAISVSSGKSIDAVVHCAGGFRFGKLEDLSVADLDFLIGANLRSTLLLFREVMPHFRKNGFGRGVVISSKVVEAPPSGLAAYAASKGALEVLLKGLSEECKGQNISLNALAPSIIDTPDNRKAMPKADFSEWVDPAILAESAYALVNSKWMGEVSGSVLTFPGRV